MPGADPSIVGLGDISRLPGAHQSIVRLGDISGLPGAFEAEQSEA